MQSFFPKILTTAALSLAAAGLNSCTTLIDSGSMLDNVGKQEPSRLLEAENSKYNSWFKESPLVAWKKGDTYYVEMPVASIPAGIRHRDSMILNISLLRNEQFYYPDTDSSDKMISGLQKKNRKYSMPC